MPVVAASGSAPTMEALGAHVQSVMRGDWPGRLRDAVSRGFDREPVVITDRVVWRHPDLVQPFGRIEFVARVDLAELIFWANAELYRRSPVGPVEGGHYRNDHVLMINGSAVPGNWRVALQRLQGGDRIQLVNPRPYARKLEGATGNKRGRGRRRGSSRQAPNGIYRPVVAEIVRRWGRSVFVEFKYVPLNTGLKVWGKQGGASEKRVLRDQVYPAISIFVKPSQARL